MTNMEPAGNVLPIYFVADESGSMGNVVDEMNAGMRSLLDEIALQPFAAAAVRFTVIGFNNEARCYLSNADLRYAGELQPFVATYQTYFSTAFDMLSQLIPQDIANLKAEGYRVNRPAVFLMTDGYPMDDDMWEEALADLMALPQHPNLLCFGLGDGVNASIISQMASSPSFAYRTAQGADTGKMLANFMSSLTQSVISSGNAVGAGGGQLQAQVPEGFLQIDADEV